MKPRLRNVALLATLGVLHAPSGAIAGTITDAGVSARVPSGWHAHFEPLTVVSSPLQRLVVASFAVRQHRRDGGCRPATAPAQMPKTGALLFMFEYRGPTRHDLAKTPPRPRHFRLDPRSLQPYECMGRSYMTRFRDHGRVFQAHIYLGADASTQTREAVVGVLDSLVIDAPTPRAVAVWTRPDRLLAKQPYLGVSCPQPNRYSCDRVGLSVTLRDPAVRVIATVDGRSFNLDDPHWSGPVTTGQRRTFAGFLHPAGLLNGRLKIIFDDGPGRWIGGHPKDAGVELAIETRSQHYVRTSLVVPLAPGWG